MGGAGEPAIEWSRDGGLKVIEGSDLQIQTSLIPPISSSQQKAPSKKLPAKSSQQKARPRRLKIPFGLNLIYTSWTHDRAHPPDSMHRCLNVDEILRLIAYELVASGTKAAAVCMACCCKCFQDPVLDTLWATQFDLSPLSKCFLGDIWNEGGYKVSAPTTCFFFLH